MPIGLVPLDNTEGYFFEQWQPKKYARVSVPPYHFRKA